MSDKKVAFISGGNRGLGFETARELAEKGVRVVIGSRDKSKGEEAVKKLKDMGLEIESFTMDVNKPADHKALEEFLKNKFGKLDILVNNAGVFLDNGEPTNKTSQTPQEILRKTFDANFFNLIALTQTLLPLIKKAPTGRIVNLSSILGSLNEHSNPKSMIYDFKGGFAYNASKTALNAFTVHLAHELKDTQIKVNSAHPGWVQTEMGGKEAPIPVSEGGKTSSALALLPDNGPTGEFIHQGERLPW